MPQRVRNSDSRARLAWWLRVNHQRLSARMKSKMAACWCRKNARKRGVATTITSLAIADHRRPADRSLWLRAAAQLVDCAALRRWLTPVGRRCARCPRCASRFGHARRHRFKLSASDRCLRSDMPREDVHRVHQFVRVPSERRRDGQLGPRRGLIRYGMYRAMRSKTASVETCRDT